MEQGTRAYTLRPVTAKTGPARSTVDPRINLPAGARLADGAFVILAVLTVPLYFSRLGGYEFAGDDWRLFQRGNSFGDLIEPYRGHLNSVLIFGYRVLLEFTGLGSTLPLRVVGVVSLLSVAVAMYLVVRSRLGAAVALPAAAALLWYHGLVLAPASFGDWLAIAAIIVCAWALTNDEPSGDWALVIGLGFALAASAVGLMGAIGCLAYLALSRPPWRRWLFVGLPAAGWVGWWLVLGRDNRGGADPSTGALEYAWDGIFGSFRGFVLGNAVLGALVAVAFAAYLVWRVTRGPSRAFNELSWTVAFVGGWLSLGFLHTDDGSPPTHYLLAGSALVILALLPARPTKAMLEPLTRSRADIVAIAVSVLIVVVNLGSIVDESRALAAQSRAIRQQLVVANLGPGIVPDNVDLPLPAPTSVRARVYRSLTEEHDIPESTRTDDPDAKVIATGPVRPRAEGDDRDAPCFSLAPTTNLAPGSAMLLRAPDRDVEVELRRFGPEWVRIGQISQGAQAWIAPPALEAAQPWILRAPGACRVDPAAATTIVAPVPDEPVAGTVPLIATTESFWPQRLEFRLTGDDFTDRKLGDAQSRYGWTLEWDSTSVPNGTYALTSVAVDGAGNMIESEPIELTVAN